MARLKMFTGRITFGFGFIFLLLTSALAQFQPAQMERAEISDRQVLSPKLEQSEEIVEFSKFAQAFFSNSLITASTYPFSFQTSVALEDMSTGTTLLVGANADDTASAVTNIGFEFWYDGVRFTQFSVNANGLARLGATAIATTFNNSTSGLNTTVNAPKIAPFFEDLCTGSTGGVRYKVVGSAPNRKLVVEWFGMQISRGAGCVASPATGNFQMWLFETTGVIQFVYGGGIVASAPADAGASIGLQSGAATNFASVTASTDTVSYDTHDPLNAAGIPSGKSYVFTPLVPNAPSGLNFTAVTQTGFTVNWTDNATNEVGYVIYRSTDGTNFSFLTQTAADATSISETGLFPGTTYFYRIFAVTEGALSPVLAGSQATNPPGNDTCNGAGGNWSNTATWADGTVPTVADNVTIGSGCTVTVDTADAVALNVTINNGGTLQSPLSGTTTDNNLTIGGNLTNNGTLDFSTNGNTSGAILTFGPGSPSSTFSGTGAVTDLRAVTIAKGSIDTTVLMSPINLTIQGVNTDIAGFLTLTSGRLVIAGNFELTNRLFTTAAYTIPAAAGLQIASPNLTVAAQNGSPTVSGSFRMTQGTYNIGTSTGNSMGFNAGSNIVVEGGTINVAGRFGVAAAANAITYSQTGGTITVQTVGNTSTTLAGFDLGTSLASNISISGGTIVIQLANTGGSGPRDYRHQAGSGIAGVIGATLQLGNALSGAAKTFIMRGVVPNLVVDNTSAGHTGQWDTTLTNYNNISRNITINPGTTVNHNNVIFLFAGTTYTNNGTMTHNGASSRFITFRTDAAQTYTGSGTVTAPMTSFEFQSDLGFTFDSGVSTVVTNRIINFIGNVNNANKLTVGNGGITTATVQLGNTSAGAPTAAGIFDSQVGFNPGTGGIVISYLRTTTSRVTGGEFPATRIVNNLTFDNIGGNTLTITGGDATVSGALALTNGEILTGTNTLTHNGAVTRTNGFVNGNLRRDFSSTGAYTYHVGQNGYSPVAANVTAGTGSLSVRAVGTAQPNIPTPSKALSRYWNLSGTGVTSDLTFSYLDPADIPGTADENDFVIVKYDGAFTQPGGTVNTGANTATITGVSSFSDWTLAEPGALVSPGVLALSNSTYSVNENAGSVTVTVNRTGGTDGAVGIDYSLGGGTATGGASCGAGIDYINTGGTVSFANGEASKTFNVIICDDSTVESDETFDVTLSNPTGGATLGTPAAATVTILDDDVVTGPVTVTASAGTTSGSYNTLTEAVAAINDGTHQGDIVVNINQNTTEPGTIVLNSSGAGSASYSSVLIRPGADSVTVSGASAQGRGLIELNGADNVTIDGDNPNTTGTNRDLTLHNTATSTTTFTSVVRIALNTTTVTSADNNIVRNLNIVGSSPGRNVAGATTTGGSENTTFGIFLGPNASGATTAPTAVTSVSTGVAAGATASNLLIQNNRVVTAARAISINGAATSVAPGLQIRNNEIGNSVAGAADQVTAIGITVNGSSNAVIAGNLVWVEGFVASSAAGHGINVGVNSTNTTGAVIEKNRVNRVKNNNGATWSAYGINVTGIAGSAHVVRNNFVSGVINDQTAGTGGFGTTFGAYGIRVGSGTNHQIYHNSVNLYGAMGGVNNTNLTAAFVVVATGQTGVDVRNNIFVNTITGGNPTGTRNVAVFLPSGATSAMNLTLNNNDYFVGSDAQNRLAQVGTTFGTGEYTLDNFDPTTTTPATNFRAYTSTLAAGGNNDNASKKVDPSFTSNVDLHILATSLMESAGVNVGVVDDIDGDPRPAVPDIGADEITVSGPGQIQFGSTSYSTNEGSAATINVIRSAGLDGTVGVTVTLTDGTATGGAACTAGVDYINPGPQTLTFGNGVGLQTFNVQTCSDGTLKANETVNLTLSNPTGGATIGTNNPATLTIVDVPPPLSGTINVGTGEVFTSLTNPGGVFQAINAAGLNGDLTINITSDLTAETGAVVLNQFAEFGAGGYTLTIKPSGAARTISGTGATSNGLINLNGADRVVIDGSLSGGTDRSLTIVNLQTGTSTVIWIRSASAGNGASNNTIKNTVIHGAGGATAQTTAGILAGSGTTIGGPAEAPNNNNSVLNNWIHTVQNSLYNQGNTGLDQNWLIADNEFGSTVDAEKNRFRGMLMGNANNFVIRNNTVLGVTNFTGTTGALTGIQLAFAVTNGFVTGNRISNVHNLSTSGTGAFGMQLSATPTTNILIANNFIWNVIAAGSATVANNGHGITVNGAATAGGYKIYHNSINLNTNQASGTTAALNLTSAVVAAGALDVRNNIFANTQTAGATRRAVHSAAAASVFSTINYNDYFSTGSVGFIGGTDRPTLAEWQTGTGQDANSLAVDPLFVSAADLHIQSGSPMINAGTPLADVVTDIDGDPRSATTPDIGADEFVGSGNPGSLQFSSPTYSGSEGASPFTVTVTRTGGSDGTVTVDFATSNGTATGGASCTAGVDYITTNGTLTFANGVTSQTFNVVICDDLLDEPDETFNYTLSNPTGGAVLGTPSTAVQTIEDNDPAAGSLSVNDVRVFEGNAGTVNMTFTVTHTGAGFAAVDYSTSNGTATAGVDYLATSGTLTFNTPIYNAAGIPQQTQTVTVSVVGDTFKEANETLFLNLSNPVNASITDAQGAGIIIDDDRAYVADSDRDLKGDIGIYRPSEGTWYIAPSTGGAPLIVDLGDAGTAVPGDYDGDGKMDLAAWDAATGIWTIRSSQTSGIYTEQLGQAGDIPVQGDYDGDGRTDLAIFRPSTGDWWIRRSSNSSFYTVNFGLSGDRPVQGDYDGDAKTDIAVYRGGVWYIFQSRTNTIRIASWGLPTDIPLSGDFDGDGSNDLAIYRNGQWWILDSLTNTSRVANWGVATDIPAPADYDGDGTTDIVVFRPSTGDWYLLYSGGGSGGSNWGLAGDVPAATAYMPY